MNAYVHILIAFLIFTALVFLSVSGLLAPVIDGGRVTVNFLTGPLVIFFRSVAEVLEVLGSLGDLHAQNRILTKQAAELTAELSRHEETEVENRALRDALAFLTKSKPGLIPAEVIVFDPFDADGKITLNRGSDHGVRAQDAVVAPGSILVGVITSVLPNTSQMALITSSDVTINAKTADGQAIGVARGEHGLGLSFDLVSHTESIKSGDRVVTSGLGGAYPPNLFLGEVGEIRPSGALLFQSASITPAVNLRSLRAVFILKK